MSYKVTICLVNGEPISNSCDCYQVEVGCKEKVAAIDSAKQGFSSQYPHLANEELEINCITV